MCKTTRGRLKNIRIISQTKKCGSRAHNAAKVVSRAAAIRIQDTLYDDRNATIRFSTPQPPKQKKNYVYTRVRLLSSHTNTHTHARDSTSAQYVKPRGARAIISCRLAADDRSRAVCRGDVAKFTRSFTENVRRTDVGVHIPRFNVIKLVFCEIKRTFVSCD